MTMKTDDLRVAQGYFHFTALLARTYEFLSMAGSRIRHKDHLRLDRLDDHLLQDIGLTRADVQRMRDGSIRIADVETRRLHL